jgi:hypothetical protein
MGGSVPLGAIERAARTRTITVPIANYDDNQYAANENLRLQNLWDGGNPWLRCLISISAEEARYAQRNFDFSTTISEL